MNSESLEIHIALQLDDSSTSVDISVILKEDMVPDSLSDMSSELEASSSVGSQTGPVDEELASDSRNDTDLSSKSESKDIDIEYPEVTISAFTETGQAELSIEVPLQRVYTGRKPIIPSLLADTSCSTLGVQGSFDQLNILIGTSHTLDQSLSSILEDYISNDYDFGTAYGYLRQTWKITDPGTIQDNLCRCKEEDQKKRQEALVGNQVTWNLEARRVWDLYSNRVVPLWVTNLHMREIWPISHAWMDEKDRVGVWTSINGKEWPVPIPKDTDLNLIRIEMLNLGAEYVWLDVLCLRQEGGPREELREKEWMVDVPTIGGVYDLNNQVVIYLSGLGRPFSLKDGDLEHERNWFRRAWTVQEVGSGRIIAGDTPDGPTHAEAIDQNGNYKTEILTKFHNRIKYLWDRGNSIFGALVEMQTRVSTKPMDQVAGLAFILGAERIPVYYESKSLEDAWTALVNSMMSWMRSYFLLQYPEVGQGCKKWHPSWEQVMKESLPVAGMTPGHLYRDNESNEDWYQGPCIEEGLVQGLDKEPAEGSDRHGVLTFKDAHGKSYIFPIVAFHQCLIPEDTYTLLGDEDHIFGARYWAIGRRLPDKRFQKVSVFEIPEEEGNGLWRLCKKHKNILV
ncbi:hypothetical protein ARMGADRAFT_979875 [Armillaria gallica]|uniref:Heterokaryon incompatibility domain-containing protein n=1 Tax=Armillaria gallica TaxID=47427 RepID=A0A2H3EAM8_ARMGA|nr:hypothetical protein ARMGADRAFT_979875 [Armillaria gallica]